LLEDIMSHPVPASRPAARLAILAPWSRAAEEILTSEACAFLAALTQTHRPTLHSLLQERAERRARFEAGAAPDFLESTRFVRESSWTVAPVPDELQDRRVEITGPVDRKMIINAMNSGANVFMADFEDSTAPTWANVLEGQVHLRDAVAGTIRHVDPRTGKVYALVKRPAVLMVRPRGLHLPEKHLLVDEEPLPGALMDFGLFVFHNARRLIERGSGPYVYLPKLESHAEARWWNEVFLDAQERLGIPPGTIKATVLIETLPAAFEMDEILHELREHAAGLNCGRWDYIFSTIKTLGRRPGFLLPDRGQVGMYQPFLRAYTQLLVQTCHRRQAHAIGGMAAQIPIKNDEEAHGAALDKVRADKLREVTDGHDGTWVAHPALVPVARGIFDAHMKGKNQLHVLKKDLEITAEDLKVPPRGTQTEAGLRQNVNVGLLYLEAWLRGTGCVPLYHLMEDTATAEISRAQIWQWLHHGAELDDGQVVTVDLFQRILGEEMERIRTMVGPQRFAAGRFREARDLFARISTDPTFPEFLTLFAYDELLTLEDPEEA
jgi:malate synthase